MEIIKKLRIKILVLNMVITSSVMLSAFTFIFFITYNNVNSEIEEKLNITPSGVHFVYQEGSTGKISASVGASGTLSVTSDDFQIFSMLVDSQGRILEKASGIDFDSDFLEEAARTALKYKDSKETALGGRQWRYTVTPIIRIDSRDGNNANSERYVIDIDEIDTYSVVFLDVTSYKKTLFDLFITLLVVGVITLGAIYFISVLFAGRATRPLASAWQKQKQFIADASHELKTPLSIISANYDVLVSNKTETVESQMKWLEYMRIGMDRMSELINGLLISAKFDDEKNLVRSRFNLSETVRSVILTMEAAYINKNIRLSENIEPDVPVESDAEGLKQVITILLDNAIKYTDHNGEIEITLEKGNGKIVFSIKNTGKGISDYEIHRIFDRFYRSDESRSHEDGSYGLGLSIAKAILNGVGGVIQVQSREDEWTVFTFTLKYS